MIRIHRPKGLARCAALLAMVMACAVWFSSDAIAQTAMDTVCVSPNAPNAPYEVCETVPNNVGQWSFVNTMGGGPFFNENDAIHHGIELYFAHTDACNINFEVGDAESLEGTDYIGGFYLTKFMRTVGTKSGYINPELGCIGGGHTGGFAILASREVACQNGGQYSDANSGKIFCVYERTRNLSIPNICPAEPTRAGQAGNRAGLFTPNPIVPALASKVRDEVDHGQHAPHGITLARHYVSSPTSPSVPANGEWRLNHVNLPRLSYQARPLPPASPVPCKWPSPNLTNPGAIGIFKYYATSVPCLFNGEPIAPAKVSVEFGANELIEFTDDGGSGWLAQGHGGSLQKTDSGFFYVTPDQRTYAFTLQGDLTTVTERNGWANTYVMGSNHKPVSVTNHFGKSMQFTYDGTGELTQALMPDGRAINYTFDTTGRLLNVAYPDGNSRNFYYDNTVFPSALTGIGINGVRFSTYAYDSRGRAVNSQLTGGVGSYQVSYGASDTYPVAITDPKGTERTYQYSKKFGIVMVSSASAATGHGIDEALWRNQNGLGLIETETDFLGNTKMYTWDLSRRLPTGVKRAAYQPAEITTSTEWHPTQSLPAKVAEPGVVTTNIYNGQPDPFNGNGVASCAPTTAKLPDGAPIAVLCKRVEQATADANGAMGLSPTLQSAVPARVWRWTYNADAQVLTETNPLNRTNSYTYYTDTTSAHTRGDLQSATNAMGHTTLYTQYNGAGNVLQSTDPNGVISAWTYDARQRLTSLSQGTETTTYTYTAWGDISRITMPNGSTLDHGYDSAQRLISVADNQGNRVDYTLDNAGNRIAEQRKDGAGALRAQLTRAFDALGRQQTVSGGLFGSF